MTKLKLGIIGIGNMGSSHSTRIVAGNVPDIELVAVADRFSERREWAKNNLPESIKIFEEGTELIDSRICDAVLIATPHYQHPELSIRTLQNAQHVLCEKPAGVYTKQVLEMNKVAAEHDLVFAMMFNQRTNHVYRKMKEIVSSGELGEIRRTNWIITDWYRTQYYYDSGAWRATWGGEGGGVLLNQCPHNLDLMQWICGMPTKLQAHCHNGRWHDIEVEDDVTAYLEYENGATGVFITSTGDAPGTNRFEITMDGGKLVCDKNELKLYRLKTPISEHLVTSKNGFEKPEGEWVDIETDGFDEQHDGVLKAFAAAILRGEPLVAHGSEGINGLALSNAMHLSSWTGKMVSLPVDPDVFYDELQKRVAGGRIKTGESVVSDTSSSY